MRKLQVRFTSAQIETVLQKLTNDNIVLYDIMPRDALTMDVWIAACDLDCLDSVMEYSATKYSVIARKGALWYVKVLLRRPVLIFGLLLLSMMAFWLPGKILFVEVEGNHQISERLILASASDCGICFGADRSAVRSEKTKNELLSKIPQLQWVGINTSGCIAKISVQEGMLKEDDTEVHRVSAIVASTDGVIDSVSVLKGTALCTEGQSVKRGDLLISGYTDCGLKILAETAKGEVYAFTNHLLDVVGLKPTAQKRNVLDRQVFVGLRIGKKLIKLWNDSGISGATCGKMYLEDYWTLPGGFRLPIATVKIITIHYSAGDRDVTYQPIWLAEFAEEYLRRQMNAGEILTRDISFQENEQYWELSGAYDCHEMIGKVKYEETLLKNAKDN